MATHLAKAAADVQTRDIGDREMTNAGLVDATIVPATSEAVSALDIHFVAEAVLRDGALDVADLR